MTTIPVVTIMVPLTLLDIQVQDLTEESVIDAVAKDLQDLDSHNSWEITWDDLKYAVRNGEVSRLSCDHALITC
jgi:hypothetical protein